MNERIKELAEQCVFSEPLFISFDQQKFAELIVKECVSQCWTVSELEHKGDVVYQCSKRIQKHFGVEE